MNRLPDIERDIDAFADPGTEVAVDKEVVYWEQDGQERTANLRAAPGRELPDLVIEGVQMSYRDFLAGPHMANLDRLAEFMPKTIRAEDYIPTRGSTSDIGTRRADELVATLACEDLRYGSTRIVLVHGEAGSGKTMALKRMTIDRARQHPRPSSSPLFFYIDVQGRALSRLEDAMARDLQDLRSRFSYDAVPSLVRNGLLVPVIDGFDELLGTGGYEDAYSSLAALISQLDGCGAIIASARSAFLDYNSFRENAERYSGDGPASYDIETVRIEPWTDEDAEELLSKKAGGGSVIQRFRTVRDGMDQANRALLRKPFYVSQIASLLLDGEGIESNDMILDKLVDSFIKREHSKLRNKEGSALLTLSGHHEFLVRLAEEMWWLETRHLDAGTVKAWMELVLEDLGVPEEDARQIRTRVPTYGFLTTAGTSKRTLRFEHEVFYAYFLAEKLKRCIASEPRELRRFLSRSMLDETLVDQTVRRLGSDIGEATQAAGAVCSVLTKGLTEGIARQNGGRLVARIIAYYGGLANDAVLRNLYFEHDSFGESALVRPRFINCYFNEVDLTRTRMNAPQFADCVLQVPRVTIGRTSLIGASADLGRIVRGIVVVDDSSGEAVTDVIYAPDRINSILGELGVELPEEEEDQVQWGYTAAQRRRIKILENFLGKMKQRFRLSRDDLARLRVVKEEEWGTVYDLLETHGLLKEERRGMSGRPKLLIRLAYPPDIIRMGEDTSDGSRAKLTAFWRDLLDC